MTLISRASDINIKYMLLWTDSEGNIYQETFDDETSAIAVGNIKSDKREGSDRCIVITGVFDNINVIYNPGGYPSK